MPRDDAARLRDILEACDRILRAIEGMDVSTFAADDVVIRAVLYDFAVIGEATNGISADKRERHPEVPWSDMAGMRNVVIHQYFGVDAALVWRAATVSVPNLRRALRQITG